MNNEYDGWNVYLAQLLSKKFNNESIDFLTPGGWRVAGCWHANISDDQFKMVDDTQLKFLLKKQAQHRAYEEYLRLTKR
jgi:hypothetical protein